MKLSLGRKRVLTQVASTLAANAYVPGFLTGRIYAGPGKLLCVPFLNCYSCPGAVASCPVGAIQSLAVGHRLSLYVMGLVLSAGALVGRAVCGWLCPFGLYQDLLYRLSRLRLAIPGWLTGVKYGVMVLIVPLAALWTGGSEMGAPHFCSYICPAGTLQAAIPLLLLNPPLRALAGALLAWKLAGLALISAASVATLRPFCRVLCPLGAFYGLLNPVSVWAIRVDETRCCDCGSCRSACPLDLKIPEAINHRECIRCLRCTGACPSAALRFGPPAQVLLSEGREET